MDVENVKKYAGKKVFLVLKNNYEFTTLLPNVIQESFSIIDKFGSTIEISCSFIEYIKEIKNKEGDSNVRY